MPTIVKSKGNTRTYACADINNVYAAIQGGTYRTEKRATMVRFAADYRKTKGSEMVTAFCGLTMLSICNLPGEQEANAVLAKIRNIPHTLLAYRSDDRRSVYLVCRLAWNEATTPTTTEQMLRYLQNGYKLSHYLYANQLTMLLDTEAPSLSLEFPLSYDPEAYLSLQSTPFYVDDSELDMPRLLVPEVQKGVKLLTGMDERETLSYIFHSCHHKAILKARQLAKDELTWHEKVLDLLAQYCYESGLPQGYATSHARLVTSASQHEVDIIFTNAYAEELLKPLPFGHVDKNAMLTLQTEAFLNAYYQLRRNTLTGEVQYRERSAYVYDYRPLTEQVLNSMTIRALKVGIGSWDKDVRRLMNSNDIELFDPLAEYMMNLPRWDGKDRVAELASRIPCQWKRAGHFLHTWLLSMVAHWLGKDSLHGNAIVPLLIGDQGCGKTTLASIILPPDLRTYYNDKVDFRGDSDLMAGLSSFALINIDEFDSLKKSQQPTLKYLLSKSEVKFRPAYGKTIEHRRRYASFIATTNLSHPLVDRTGSRRFMCIRVTSGKRIDTYSPIYYEQLYAQLYAEIRDGHHYWLDEAETAEVQEHNAQYVRLTNLSEMIDSVIQITENEDTREWHSIEEILNRLNNRYSYFVASNSTHRDIGRLLTEKGLEKKKANTGTLYKFTMK